MKQPYTTIDEEGNHILEALREYEYEDPSLSSEVTMQREGVQIIVRGRNPDDVSAMLEYLYLKTRHLPGYAQDPETHLFTVKEAEIARTQESEKETLKKHYSRVTAIRKRQAIKAVREGK